jgi:hypothetical protein
MLQSHELALCGKTAMLRCEKMTVYLETTTQNHAWISTSEFEVFSNAVLTGYQQTLGAADHPRVKTERSEAFARLKISTS